MRWLLLTTMLAGAAAQPAQAQISASPDGPVCRRPEVLEFVGRELRRRILYARIDRAYVWEEPTAETDVVRCSVCLDPRPAEPGQDPARACQTHAFEVQSLRAGFVVRGID
jgi:hypothetical protein